MVIFQDENPAIGTIGKFIEEGREHHLEGKWLKGRRLRCVQEREGRPANTRLEGCLAGSNDVTPEKRRFVVPGIKRNPGEWREVVASEGLTVSHPLAYQRGFAVACWCGEQHELAREGDVKLCEQ